MFFTQISQIARISPHRCARGGVCHTDSTDSTDFSASRCLHGLARVSYSPCPAGRNLVNLINLFLRDSVRVRGLESCRFLYGIAGCARWIGLSLARVFLFACSLRSRNPVNLVDYFPSGIFSGCGYFNLVDFLQGIAGCARWIGLSLARGVTQISQIPQIFLHRCARGFLWHTDITDTTDYFASLRSRFFLCHTDYTDITDYFASLRSRWALGGGLINN